MARFHSIHRLLHRVAQIDRRQRALLAEATVSLFVARLALIFVSFPRLAQGLGTLVPPSDPRIAETSAGAGPDEVWIAKEVSWAVTRAARYALFKAVCLPQALVAHRMLRRRGIASVMHFGAVNRDNEALDTHAWLNAAGVEVTGFPVATRLAEIACFI
jgi:hypothetical protein